MRPAIDELAQLVGRPPSVVEAGAADAVEWTMVERRLGLGLPTDFKQLLEAYGVCKWGDFLHLLSPFTANEHLLLERAAHRALGAAREIRRQYAEDVPFALYPESCGLFPCGVTDNGDTLYWLTQGPCSAWPIVILQARDPRAEQHNLSVSTLLLHFLRGDLESRILLEPFEGEAPMTQHRW